jgi:hypothetical protein
MAPVPLPAASGCSRIGQPTFAARQAVTQMRREPTFAGSQWSRGVRDQRDRPDRLYRFGGSGGKW